jgi:hypothetical protein
MTKRKLIICDDEPDLTDQWTTALKTMRGFNANFSIVSLSLDELNEQIEKLEARRDAARKGTTATPEPIAIDEASVLVVDYDLIHARTSYLTGEVVAYLARCYSNCSTIVALNQYGSTPWFDLTLRGHPGSYADVNIAGDQLMAPSLWGEIGGVFRPSYWPILPAAADAFSRRTKRLLRNLDKPILASLGFPDTASAILPRSAIEFISKDEDYKAVTFKQFVFQSGNGLKGKDKDGQLTNLTIARIASARIGKWLERLILPGQDILVDAPHLATRNLNLLSGDVRSKATWNKTSARVSPSSTGLRHGKIEKFLFVESDWLSRPAWFWPELREDESLASNQRGQSSELVFCEDISRFETRDKSADFVADLASPFVKRFVIKPSERKKVYEDLDAIEYKPGVRLSY